MFLRAVHPQISFADWELMRQGLVLEPVLQAIADFLDDHEGMIEAIRSDLRRGLKNPNTGRNGLSAQQVLRSLIVMRVKNWDYRELRERIADGYTLRQFTGFYCQPVPKHDAFNRGFNRLTPDTLRAVNDLVIQAAVGLGLEGGTKLRVDTTVVNTPSPPYYGVVRVSPLSPFEGFRSTRSQGLKHTSTKGGYPTLPRQRAQTLNLPVPPSPPHRPPSPSPTPPPRSVFSLYHPPVTTCP